LQREAVEKPTKWYSAGDYLALRKDESAFRELADFFIPKVVGVRLWDREKKIELVSKICSESDIAFLILTLLNNEEYWNEYAGIE
jgi:hypothetical protein